jgi:hypothetical protein
MPPAYVPGQFIQVKAYLLDEGVPPERVLLGLETIRSNFQLYTAPDGDFLISPDGTRIRLRFKEHPTPHDPGLLVPRLQADVLFEPYELPCDARTFFAGAILDTGAPFAVIPFSVHKSGRIKIHQELGRHVYRVLSMEGPQFQRFVVVGIRFFALV